MKNTFQRIHGLFKSRSSHPRSFLPPPFATINSAKTIHFTKKHTQKKDDWQYEGGGGAINMIDISVRLSRRDVTR